MNCLNRRGSDIIQPQGDFVLGRGLGEAFGSAVGVVFVQGRRLWGAEQVDFVHLLITNEPQL
ncbi:hypothetical protein KDC22_15330 [Paenibacillus tritici]|uniref:hypothetical protein n=1 Tax=Paenibacillus tritici TaxID=1873425 RepID=UPI001BA894B2|nr:hypothetical protein [Paenibacillus tritici]QUL57731.1 hypothetical protein KDC22_15330 [Paenibacillus tritici]